MINEMKELNIFFYLGKNINEQSNSEEIHYRPHLLYTFICNIIVEVPVGHGDTSSNPGRDWLHLT